MADAMGGTYFMTWNLVHVNSGPDNIGGGALDVDKTF
jgi:hypothetical protein